MYESLVLSTKRPFEIIVNGIIIRKAMMTKLLVMLLRCFFSKNGRNIK